jgi:DNA repair photolyase
MGINVVLAKQKNGFWGHVGDGLSHPVITQQDIPDPLFTFEPWLGCLWGKSCKFCYVPNLSAGFYPGGRNSEWYRGWGNWLVLKPNITTKLRKRLLDSSGKTRKAYRGASIFMSAKTDPFLPVKENLQITKGNLRVFADADVFVMCQTRSAQVTDDAEILELLQHMAKRGKAGVSFSISTDILGEQQRSERGGISPLRRMEVMEKLKSKSIFVTAAVCPIMPFSYEFPGRLLECSNHASVQILRPAGSGSSTPKEFLDDVHDNIPHYGELDLKLVEKFSAQDQNSGFSWGIGAKGFIGGFVAARRFYNPAAKEPAIPQHPRLI